ncbi:MAG: hypothetical protein RLZZ592_1648, partial [Pseudomonadota bacterium]
MRRLRQLAALGAAVLALHALLLAWFGERLRMALSPEPAIERLSAVYTREVVRSAPPLAAAAAGPRPAARPPVAPVVPAAPVSPPEPPEAPASAPPRADAAEISVSAEPPLVSASPQPPDFDPQAAPGSVAAAPPGGAVAASAPAAAASGPAFEWPVSTRLRYTLTGWYQGEVHGEAQVEWLRSGERYQVH